MKCARARLYSAIAVDLALVEIGMATLLVGGGDVGTGRAARRPPRRLAQPFEFQVRDRELGRLGNAGRAILGRDLEQGAGFGLIARRQLQQAEIHLGVADALGLRFLASGRHGDVAHLRGCRGAGHDLE